MKKITEKQKQNAFGLFDTLAKSSITSPELRIAIVCVAAKESGLIPKREKLYANTSNERIRKIFGRKKLREFYSDDDALNWLKKHPVAFFNEIYAGVAGNGDNLSGDGYNYRGGGYNQLTGRANYRAAQNATWWALVDRPSLITWPECAAEVLVTFFERALKSKKTMDIIDEFVTDDDRSGLIIFNGNFYLFAAAWINAGIGKKPESPAVQRAYKKALDWLPAVQALYLEWSEQK